MSALPGLVPVNDQQFQPIEFGRIVTADTTSCTVELDATRWAGRQFGPYPYVRVALSTVASPDSHTHETTTPSGRCLVVFNAGSLADAVVIPIGS